MAAGVPNSDAKTLAIVAGHLPQCRDGRADEPRVDRTGIRIVRVVLRLSLQAADGLPRPREMRSRWMVRRCSRQRRLRDYYSVRARVDRMLHPRRNSRHWSGPIAARRQRSQSKWPLSTATSSSSGDPTRRSHSRRPTPTSSSGSIGVVKFHRDAGRVTGFQRDSGSRLGSAIRETGWHLSSPQSRCSVRHLDKTYENSINAALYTAQLPVHLRPTHCGGEGVSMHRALTRGLALVAVAAVSLIWLGRHHHSSCTEQPTGHRERPRQSQGNRVRARRRPVRRGSWSWWNEHPV